MNEPFDGALLMCFTPEQLDSPNPDSYLDKCTSCRCDVYVSPHTLKDIADHHPGITPLILCLKCSIPVIEETETEFATTPQQRAGWRRVLNDLRGFINE